MTIQLDDLLDTEVPDFKRDRWGRPHILQPDGKRKGYTRCSSAAKTIEDTFNLEKWARRNVAYGLAHDASLVARILAIGGEPSTWDKPDKDAVNDVVEAAEQVAKAHKAADIGTAVHKLTEKLDRGETVVGGPYQADLDAYTATMRSYGFVVDPRYVECRMVNDDLEMAGTADRIIRRPDGTWAIADIKTSASVEFGGLGWAAQLAAYATGTLYDVDSEQRIDTPDIDKQVGYIIHLPAGQGRCDLYQVDLAAGLDAARLANQIRATRKAAKDWITACEKPATPVSTAVHDRDALRTRAKALTVDQLNEFKALNLDPNDLAGIAAALDRIENPSTTVEMAARIRAVDPPKPAQAAPAKPDEGDTISDDDIETLRQRNEQVRAANPAVFGWMVELMQQARQAGVDFHTKGGGGALTVRRYELCRGLLHLGEWLADPNNQALEALVWAASGHDDAVLFSNVPAGQALGSLNADQAQTFSQLVDDLIADRQRLVVIDGEDNRCRLEPAA